MKRRETPNTGYERQPPLLDGDHLETNNPIRIELDIEKYRPHLDDENLTPEQATELLTALWSIITSFVELGFKNHPVQQACGQVKSGTDCHSTSAQSALQSSIQDFMSESKRGVEPSVEEEST